MLTNLISRHLITAFEELPINLHLQSHRSYFVCFTLEEFKKLKILF